MARRKKGINLITLILIILVIIIAITVIVKITGKNSNKKQTNGVQNQEQEEKFVKVLENGEKLNTNSKLNENKAIEGLELSNIQLTYKDGITNLLCDVRNTSKKNIKMQEVEIVLLDEDGNTIYKMPGVIEEIEAGATKQFNTSITADFANAYDFKIIKK